MAVDPYNLRNPVTGLPAAAEAVPAAGISGFMGGLQEGQRLADNWMTFEDRLLKRQLEQEDRAAAQKEQQLADLAAVLSGGGAGGGAAVGGTRARGGGGGSSVGEIPGLSPEQQMGLTLPTIVDEITAPGRGTWGRRDELDHIIRQLDAGDLGGIEIDDLGVLEQGDPELYKQIVGIGGPGGLGLDPQQQDSLRVAAETLLAGELEFAANPLERWGYDRTALPTPEAFIQSMRTGSQFQGLSPANLEAEARRYTEFYNRVTGEQQRRTLEAQDQQRKAIAQGAIGALSLDLAEAGIQLGQEQLDELRRLYELGREDLVEKTVQSMIGNREFRLTHGLNYQKHQLNEAQFARQVSNQEALTQAHLEGIEARINESFGERAAPVNRRLEELGSQIAAVEGQLGAATSPSEARALEDQLAGLNTQLLAGEQQLAELQAGRQADLESAAAQAEALGAAGKSPRVGPGYEALYGANMSVLLGDARANVMRATEEVGDLQRRLNEARRAFDPESPEGLEQQRLVIALEKQLTSAQEGLSSAEAAHAAQERDARVLADVAAQSGEVVKPPARGDSAAARRAAIEERRLAFREEELDLKTRKADDLKSHRDRTHALKVGAEQRKQAVAKERAADREARRELAKRGAERADARLARDKSKTGSEIREEIREIVGDAAKRVERSQKRVEQLEDEVNEIKADTEFLWTSADPERDRNEALQEPMRLLAEARERLDGVDIGDPSTYLTGAELGHARRAYQDRNYPLPSWLGGSDAATTDAPPPVDSGEPTIALPDGVEWVRETHSGRWLWVPRRGGAGGETYKKVKPQFAPAPNE